MPTRGELLIFRRTDDRGMLTIPVAALCPPGRHDPYLIPALDQLQLVRWRGREMVLAGVEEIPARRSRIEYPQAWWVRIVEMTDATHTPPADVDAPGVDPSCEMRTLTHPLGG